MWVNILKYVVGLGLLTYVIATNWETKPGSAAPGLNDVFQQPINPPNILLAALIGAAGCFLTFTRWYLLVRAQDLPFTLGTACRFGAIGVYFNVFLPGAIGGDFYKAWSIARQQTRRAAAVATVLIDRLIGLMGLIGTVALVGGYFFVTDNPLLLQNSYLLFIVRSAAAIVGGAFLFWVLIGFLPDRRAHRFAGRLRYIPKLGNALAEAWLAIWLYRSRTKAVAIAFLLSLVIHFGNVLLFHYAVRAFDAPNLEENAGSIGEHGLIVPVGMTAGAFFPTPGGVGGEEAVIGLLYKDGLKRPEETGTLGALNRRILNWGFGLIGLVFFLRARDELKAATEDPSFNAPAPEVPHLSKPTDTASVHAPSAEAKLHG